MQNLNINYEYSNNKKNISAKVNDISEIKESQLKMLLNNDISCLLPVKFMQTEKMGSLYYNADNMYAFSEMFGRRKMNISDFISFSKSFLYMLDEIEGYLLSSKGVLLDCRYIFYDEIAEDYKYVLIPIENEDLRDEEILFFFGEVLKNYYENIYDDFAKEVADIIRGNGKINDISRLINKYDSKSILGKIKNNMENQTENSQFEEDIILSDRKNSPFGISPQKPKVRNKSQVDKVSKADKITENKEKKSSVKIVAFIAVQVLGVAIIVKIGMSGIEISKIVALVILLLVVDVIVARELFFKNKDGKVKEKKVKSKKEKKIKEVKKEVPSKIENKINNIPIHPKNVFESPIQNREEQFVGGEFQKEMPDEINKQEQDNKEFFQNQNFAQTQKENDDTEETILMPFPANDIETEKTVLMQPLGYIEVYDKENNITDKYIITKDKTVIGRMKAQVDLQIKNLMIGKVHAEVIFEGNKLYIKDIHSLNGVYIGENKNRIEKDVPVFINSGEVLYLADTKIKVYSA